MDNRRSVIRLVNPSPLGSFKTTPDDTPPWKRPNPSRSANTAITNLEIRQASATNVSNATVRRFLQCNQIICDQELLKYSLYSNDLHKNSKIDSGRGYRYKVNSTPRLLQHRQVHLRVFWIMRKVIQ